MKLRRGKTRYKIPAHSEVLGVHIEGNQKHNQMIHYNIMQISLVEMAGMSCMHLGMPIYFAASPEKIDFWPPPDNPYTAKVRYTPPIKEF